MCVWIYADSGTRSEFIASDMFNSRSQQLRTSPIPVSAQRAKCCHTWTLQQYLKVKLHFTVPNKLYRHAQQPKASAERILKRDSNNINFINSCLRSEELDNSVGRYHASTVCSQLDSIVIEFHKLVLSTTSNFKKSISIITCALNQQPDSKLDIIHVSEQKFDGGCKNWLLDCFFPSSSCSRAQCAWRTNERRNPSRDIRAWLQNFSREWTNSPFSLPSRPGCLICNIT